VDFVDEQNIAAFKGRKQSREIARFFNHRPARVFDIHAHRVGRGCKASVVLRSGGPLNKCVEHVAALLRRLHHELEPWQTFSCPANSLNIGAGARCERVSGLDGLSDEVSASED